jgi:hypothetical protein
MSTPGVCPVKIDGYNWVNLRRASFLKLPVIPNPLSIGNISDRQEAKGKGENK